MHYPFHFLDFLFLRFILTRDPLSPSMSLSNFTSASSNRNTSRTLASKFKDAHIPSPPYRNIASRRDASRASYSWNAVSYPSCFLSSVDMPASRLTNSVYPSTNQLSTLYSRARTTLSIGLICICASSPNASSLNSPKLHNVESFRTDTHSVRPMTIGSGVYLLRLHCTFSSRFPVVRM